MLVPRLEVTVLPRALRNARDRVGISQERLAQLAECSPALIGQIEVGKRQPSLEVAERIATALGVELATFAVPGRVHRFDEDEDDDQTEGVPA